MPRKKKADIEAENTAKQILEEDDFKELSVRQTQYIAAHIACNGVKAKAARKSGINIGTVEYWFRENESFARSVKLAEQEICADLIGVGIKRAKERSDVLLMFFCKAFMPEMFDDNVRRKQFIEEIVDEVAKKLPEIKAKVLPKAGD